MTATFTKIIQAIAILLQFLNAVNVAGLPQKWRVAFTEIMTIAQAIQAIAAHYFTPTGEKISTP